MLTLMMLAAAAGAADCDKGQPCGDSCISWDKVCHIGAPAPTPRPAPRGPSAPASSPVPVAPALPPVPPPPVAPGRSYSPYPPRPGTPGAPDYVPPELFEVIAIDTEKRTVQLRTKSTGAVRECGAVSLLSTITIGEPLVEVDDNDARYLTFEVAGLPEYPRRFQLHDWCEARQP